MDKIKMDLLVPGVEEAYLKARIKFLNTPRYWKSGSFFCAGRYVHDPVRADVEWNSKYPKGLADWEMNHHHNILTPVGQQELIDKINELVDWANANSKQKE